MLLCGVAKIVGRGGELLGMKAANSGRARLLVCSSLATREAAESPGPELPDVESVPGVHGRCPGIQNTGVKGDGDVAQGNKVESEVRRRKIAASQLKERHRPKTCCNNGRRILRWTIGVRTNSNYTRC